MKTIRPAIKNAGEICGMQRKDPNQAYRSCLYSVSVPCEEGTLLYHTLTGELIFLPSPEPTEEEREELVSRWFLVPAAFDDRRFADGVLKIAGMLRPPVRNRTCFTILTTTDCNARCFYCYEIGIRRIPMSEEIAAEAADYIHRVSGGKPVSLQWFGGEPLYNRKVIDIICTKLQEHGVEYESTMVSNGYYLDEETVQRARDDWHLKRVQITIDGTEKLYNRIKAYIDADENPYRRVMDNIRHALAAGIRVTVRLNMDANNAEDLCLLADDLAERFSAYSNLDIYAALIQKFAGGIHPFETREETENKYSALRDRLRKSGLLRIKPIPDSLLLSRCMADENASEVILPDGRTGRCEHFSEDTVTGHIQDDQRDPAVTQKWKEPLQVPECNQCALYPVCKKLQMCPWHESCCTELSRKIKKMELTDQIRAAYNKNKEV